ncbi:hypothetical protein MNBD_ALPHA08-142 [hydrothermal vent metagenome]|uniref:Uncharacterized protein n=1 Tax=hydrothermal vent metagenome TaxID=652676 RepID=A0A3B0RZV4_9ZZZZ
MTRVRSPAYPSLSLSAAIDMIRKVHSQQQSTSEPREVVLKHMGYSGPNGRALKSISALIKYGFLEKSDDDGLHVSDRAIAILYPDTDHPEKRQEELFLASRGPDLFNEIFSRWDVRPSETSLEAFLIRKGFNVNSIGEVTRAFYETWDLVSGFEDRYDSQEDQNENTEINERKDTAMDQHTPQQAKPLDAHLPKKRPDHESLFLNVTKPVFDFETVRVNTTIDNQEDLSKLISRLNKIKEMLPSKTEY